VLGLVLTESMFLAVLAGGSALGMMALLVQRGTFNNAFLPVFVFTGGAIALGAATCLALGLFAGALPAVGAMRLKITDALRRN